MVWGKSHEKILQVSIVWKVLNQKSFQTGLEEVCWVYMTCWSAACSVHTSIRSIFYHEPCTIMATGTSTTTRFISKINNKCLPGSKPSTSEENMCDGKKRRFHTIFAWSFFMTPIIWQQFHYESVHVKYVLKKTAGNCNFSSDRTSQLSDSGNLVTHSMANYEDKQILIICQFLNSSKNKTSKSSQFPFFSKFLNFWKNKTIVPLFKIYWLLYFQWSIWFFSTKIVSKAYFSLSAFHCDSYSFDPM